MQGWSRSGKWESLSRGTRIDKAKSSGRWRWRASVCPCLNAPSQELEVQVALIRDLRRLVPKAPSSEEEDRPLRWDEKPDGTHEYWLDESWQATPLPAQPTELKLIPNCDDSNRGRCGRAGTNLHATLACPGECHSRLAHPARHRYHSWLS